MYGMFDGLVTGIILFGVICFAVGCAAFWFFQWMFAHLSVVVRWS